MKRRLYQLIIVLLAGGYILYGIMASKDYPSLWVFITGIFMAHYTYTFLIIPAVLLFTFPISFESVRQKAYISKQWRWGLIIGISGLLLIANYIERANFAAMMWNIYFEVSCDVYGSCGFEPILEQDKTYQMQYDYELTMRKLFFWDTDRCYSNNAPVCARANRLVELEYLRVPIDWIQLFPSVLITGFILWFRTRDPRKIKGKEKTL